MTAPWLTAEWRSLVMLNYAIDPAVLAPLVPSGTELDLWEGEALVSMVGFLFLDTRLLGVPVPFHRDFEEINLRFYVRRRVGGEWRRGVTFIREFVPRRAIAWTASAFYNEPYRAVPTRHRGLIYEWRHHGRWHTLGAEVEGEARELPAGSAEEFIFEHYYGYTRQRDGGTVEYAVEHPRWRVWTAQRGWLEADAVALYGAEFAPALSAAPRSAFVAEGSRVTVRRAVRLPAG